ncbi:uncharacterized protein PHACADRAFT_254123 [Phanerochaete carnosa HHB-10118-sp]|uniref:2Fe-2S ferredoxin-type domain-containing protein n=1 Tax=Phanerochaete carnosa (strain HHB-10118-sp) TaxID=650164 RepID=K5WC78_PHACS|nr:uncharacterized protein PHACADRAFT_254123 [Phanerochaete carnosa HHB-10118-sp]EKM56800.1 hypothetical protein PHACADRAFT_254123 [Phanerochaete carnosa HHB-10118-sp]
MNLAARVPQILSSSRRQIGSRFASSSKSRTNTSLKSRTYHSESSTTSFRTASTPSGLLRSVACAQHDVLGFQRRSIHVSAVRQHGSLTRPAPGTGIKVHWKDSKGNLIKTTEANEGDDLLSIAHEHDIDLEGACEGSVACSTCHVILEPERYDMLPEPEDDENDMLDMAFGLTDTSRLGCQVKLTKELDGMTATLPSATRNMFVDGKKSAH